MSHDEKSSAPRRFLIDVEETIRVVLEQEDTDGDFQISVTDAGPKLMALGTATSNGFKSFDIRVSAPAAPSCPPPLFAGVPLQLPSSKSPGLRGSVPASLASRAHRSAGE